MAHYWTKVCKFASSCIWYLNYNTLVSTRNTVKKPKYHIVMYKPPEKQLQHFYSVWSTTQNQPRSL